MGYTPARAYRPSGDPTDVATAVRLLLAARRPLIHAGHGVLWAEAWEELRELAELLQAPVMTTMAGKSAFPEDHPLAAGTGGQTLARAAAHCLAHADLILGIGASFATPFTATPIPPGKVLIQVTLDVRDIDRDYPVDHAIIGDARLVLRQLISELGRLRGSSGRRDGTEVIAEIRAAREVERREWLPRLTSEEIPINPYRVIWELMHAVDRRTTIVTHDSGNPRDQTLTFYEAIAPRGYLGWGKSTQLGTGLGLALGAKLSQPGKTVVNLMGDLAFGTAAIEVETAVRERIPILTIVLNNSGLGGYHHHMPIASDRYACNVLSGRYMEVAVGLGAYSERVEDPAQIAPAISRGLAATYEGRPAVLEMVTKEEPVYPLAHQVLATIRETASV
jgi:acetolactate synthase-1/2/3 large subunit